MERYSPAGDGQIRLHLIVLGGSNWSLILTVEDERRDRCRDCPYKIRMTELGYGCKLSYYQDPLHIDSCPKTSLAKIVSLGEQTNHNGIYENRIPMDTLDNLSCRDLQYLNDNLQNYMRINGIEEVWSEIDVKNHELVLRWKMKTEKG